MLKQRTLFQIFKKENLDIIALQETHRFSKSDIRDLSNRWGSQIHHSPGTNHSKGLLTLLHPRLKEYTFSEVFNSDRCLISSLSLEKEPIYIVNVYSPCDNQNKTDFLDKLYSDINSNIQGEGEENVICAGDFNSFNTRT